MLNTAANTPGNTTAPHAGSFNKIRNLMLCIAMLSASACTYEESPAQVASDLTRHYLGRPANEFFQSYGQPSGEFSYSDGSTAYRWVSAQSQLPPANAVISKTYQAPGSTYQMSDTYYGKVETHYCELRIFTNPDNNIEKISVAVDSTGKWSASRCQEIF
jgi:hypothetical protein